MSRQRDKGTRLETALERSSIDAGLPARRQALHGTRDTGDVIIAEADGHPVIIECKNYARGYDIAGWLAQADIEGDNAGTPYRAVVYKLKGVGLANMARQAVIMRVQVLWDLLKLVTAQAAEIERLRHQVDALSKRARSFLN